MKPRTPFTVLVLHALASLAVACRDDASESEADEGDALCGDGHVDPDEECDDGNRREGDGCTRSCALGECREGDSLVWDRCEDVEMGDQCNRTCVPSGSDRWFVARPGTSESLEPTSVAIGRDDEIHVAVRSDEEGLVLEEYSPRGALVDAAAVGDIYHADLAVGEDEALVVAGTESGRGWLRRYGVDGEPRWTVELRDDVVVNDVQIDHDDDILVGGNVYENVAAGKDLFLEKYSGDGEALWRHQYNSAGDDFDSTRAVVIGSSNEVHAVGVEARFDLDRGQDLFLRKLTADGELVWTQRYDPPEHGSEEIWGAAIDDDDNVVVVGREDWADWRSFDGVLIARYAPNGAPWWIQRWGTDDTSDGEARAVAIDGAGHVVTVGTLKLDAVVFAFVVKHDWSGAVVWERLREDVADTTPLVVDVAIDSHDEIVVLGMDATGDLDDAWNDSTYSMWLWKLAP